MYVRIYGQHAKETLKAKRNLALGLLKGGNHQEALAELQVTLDMELNYYGDGTIQVGKTIKIIGTLLLLMNELGDAMKFLTRAMKIFNDNGAKNVVAEIKKKLATIKDIKEKGKAEDH